MSPEMELESSFCVSFVERCEADYYFAATGVVSSARAVSGGEHSETKFKCKCWCLHSTHYSQCLTDSLTDINALPLSVFLESWYCTSVPTCHTLRKFIVRIVLPRVKIVSLSGVTN